MHFVDTNVLLYAVSLVPEETAKRQCATNLLATTADLTLSVQVLQAVLFSGNQLQRPVGHVP